MPEVTLCAAFPGRRSPGSDTTCTIGLHGDEPVGASRRVAVSTASSQVRFTVKPQTPSHTCVRGDDRGFLLDRDMASARVECEPGRPQTVASVTLVKPRMVALRADVLPFVLAYVAEAAWLLASAADDSALLLGGVFVATALAHVLVLLFEFWSVASRTRVGYVTVRRGRAWQLLRAVASDTHVDGAVLVSGWRLARRDVRICSRDAEPGSVGGVRAAASRRQRVGVGVAGQPLGAVAAGAAAALVRLPTHALLCAAATAVWCWRERVLRASAVPDTRPAERLRAGVWLG
jgi:hypothetical protein